MCIVDREIRIKLIAKNGHTLNMFLNASHGSLEHALLGITEAWKLSFNLQNILCRMEEFYKPWLYAVLVPQIPKQSCKWSKNYPWPRGAPQPVNFYLNDNGCAFLDVCLFSSFNISTYLCWFLGILNDIGLL